MKKKSLKQKNMPDFEAIAKANAKKSANWKPKPYKLNLGYKVIVLNPVKPTFETNPQKLKEQWLKDQQELQERRRPKAMKMQRCNCPRCKPKPCKARA